MPEDQNAGMDPEALQRTLGELLASNRASQANFDVSAAIVRGLQHEVASIHMRIRRSLTHFATNGSTTGNW